jgi:hypothetical protein
LFRQIDHRRPNLAGAIDRHRDTDRDNIGG